MKFKVLRNNIFINWQKGGVILKKKVLHILHYVVLNCYRTPISKFHFEMLLFCVAQGLITLKWAKQKNSSHFLRLHLKQNVFLYLFKSKKMKKTQKYFDFLVVQVKNHFALLAFWNLHKIKC